MGNVQASLSSTDAQQNDQADITTHQNVDDTGQVLAGPSTAVSQTRDSPETAGKINDTGDVQAVRSMAVSQAESQAEAQPSCLFFRLPAELRIMIYTHFDVDPQYHQPVIEIFHRNLYHKDTCSGNNDDLANMDLVRYPPKSAYETMEPKTNALSSGQKPQSIYSSHFYCRGHVQPESDDLVKVMRIMAVHRQMFDEFWAHIIKKRETEVRKHFRKVIISIHHREHDWSVGDDSESHLALSLEWLRVFDSAHFIFYFWVCRESEFWHSHPREVIDHTIETLLRPVSELPGLQFSKISCDCPCLYRSVEETRLGNFVSAVLSICRLFPVTPRVDIRPDRQRSSARSQYNIQADCVEGQPRHRVVTICRYHSQLDKEVLTPLDRGLFGCLDNGLWRLVEMRPHEIRGAPTAKRPFWLDGDWGYNFSS